MATFKPRMDSAVFETARNLAEQRKKDRDKPIRSLAGVESVTGATEDVKEKAEQRTEELDKATFDKPVVQAPTRLADLGTSEGRLQQDINQAIPQDELIGSARAKELVGEASEKSFEALEDKAEYNRQLIADTFKRIREEAEGKVDNYKDYVEKMSTGSVAQGDIGQMSDVEQVDVQLAEMMADPTKATSNIAALSQALPSYDTRLAALQSQLYQGDMMSARGEALRQLTQKGMAEGGLDMATAQLGEEAQDYRERLGEFEGGLMNEIQQAEQDAVTQNEQKMADVFQSLQDIVSKTNREIGEKYVASDQADQISKDVDGMLSSWPRGSGSRDKIPQLNTQLKTIFEILRNPEIPQAARKSLIKTREKIQEFINDVENAYATQTSDKIKSMGDEDRNEPMRKPSRPSRRVSAPKGASSLEDAGLM